VKRDHIVKMRDVIMANNPEYSCFDDLFHHLIYLDQPKPQQFCQFCIMTEYLYEYHREEYSWHLEMPAEKQIEFSTPEMYEPFPRIANHPTYYFRMGSYPYRHFKTLVGRRSRMVEFMREGYCYSLSSWNNTDRNADRCKKYGIDDGLHVQGEWKFEIANSAWIQMKHPNVSLAHVQRRQHRPVSHNWDEDELNTIFGS